jgi:hypothetical protein
MTICAVISGFEYWEDIVDFCKIKEDWFRNRLGLALENGTNKIERMLNMKHTAIVVTNKIWRVIIL